MRRPRASAGPSAQADACNSRAPYRRRGQLQFELQFTSVQDGPRRYMHDGDLHWCTRVDMLARKAADS
jgi:hypothetical protein